MAITIDDVYSSLKQAGVEDTTIRQVIENIQNVVQEQKEEREAEKGPKSKNQFVAYVMDDGTLTDKELVGFVVQVPEDVAPSSVKDKIYGAVHSYNTTRKGRKFPVVKFGEAFEVIKGKHWKDDQGNKVSVKTKTPIQIFPISNEIPQQTNN